MSSKIARTKEECEEIAKNLYDEFENLFNK